MAPIRTVDDADWLAVCRRATEGIGGALAARPTTAERAEEIGLGKGGDRTLVIDQAAEEIVFAELDALHAGGARFTAVSEERGEVDYGDTDVKVVIDPIDGSLNAKRDFPHHALSIAVAHGATMADVVFGFVHDFGTGEEFSARRGEGAYLGPRRLDPSVTERRTRDGRLEMLGLESADPRWVAASIDLLVPMAHRLRALGAIAVTLCQVAAGRLDAMSTLRDCRAFDAAAGQLIVREAGGLVAFPRCAGALGAPLDLEPRSPVAAARSPETLQALLSLPSS